MAQVITDKQWEHFNEKGFVRIGQVATDDEFAQLQQTYGRHHAGKGTT